MPGVSVSGAKSFSFWFKKFQFLVQKVSVFGAKSFSFWCKKFQFLVQKVSVSGAKSYSFWCKKFHILVEKVSSPDARSERRRFLVQKVGDLRQTRLQKVESFLQGSPEVLASRHRVPRSGNETKYICDEEICLETI